jgi:hypothetical protein
MSETIEKQATEANDAQNIKNPHIGWMIGSLPSQFYRAVGSRATKKGKTSPLVFCTLLSCLQHHLVPTNRPLESLVQIMIVDYKLTYPSGTATAYLISGFHTPEGAKLAK